MTYCPSGKVIRDDDEERFESLNVPMASPVVRVLSSPRRMRLGFDRPCAHWEVVIGAVVSRHRAAMLLNDIVD